VEPAEPVISANSSKSDTVLEDNSNVSLLRPRTDLRCVEGNDGIATDAYTFLMLAAMSSVRIYEPYRRCAVRQLLPDDAPELRPFDTIQWMSVLKSLSGYEMYRLSRRTR